MDSNWGDSRCSGGINNSAMHIEVFGNCDDDDEVEEEQNVAMRFLCNEVV